MFKATVSGFRVPAVLDDFLLSIDMLDLETRITPGKHRRVVPLQQKVLRPLILKP